MTTIRIFRTGKEAENARRILENGDIYAVIHHDKLNEVPIEKYGVPARFKLMVSSSDVVRAAKYLAGRMSKNKYRGKS